MPRSRSSSSERPNGAAERLIVDDREVAVSNPGKVLFPEAGHTKLDLVRYYLAVADGALRGAGGRPNVMVRYPNGIGEEHLAGVGDRDLAAGDDQPLGRSVRAPGR